MFDVLGFATLSVVGFTACAEFGSYAFVHPVIRKLPVEHHVAVEKGLLRTFGRVMPVLMTASAGLALANASVSGGHGGPQLWRWAGAAALIVALVSTIIVNVPINLATGKLDPAAPPSDWRAIRHRWEVFQGIRSWLLVIGFVLIGIGFASG
jgi:uncharacterized membrane protein